MTNFFNRLFKRPTSYIQLFINDSEMPPVVVTENNQTFRIGDKVKIRNVNKDHPYYGIKEIESFTISKSFWCTVTLKDGPIFFPLHRLKKI